MWKTELGLRQSNGASASPNKVRIPDDGDRRSEVMIPSYRALKAIDPWLGAGNSYTHQCKNYRSRLRWPKARQQGTASPLFILAAPLVFPSDVRDDEV